MLAPQSEVVTIESLVFALIVTPLNLIARSDINSKVGSSNLTVKVKISPGKIYSLESAFFLVGKFFSFNLAASV